VLQPPSDCCRTHPCFVHQRRQIIVLTFSNRNNDADRHQGDADDNVKLIPAQRELMRAWPSCRGGRRKDGPVELREHGEFGHESYYIGVGSVVIPTRGSS
jgi:hypothetical protein